MQMEPKLYRMSTAQKKITLETLKKILSSIKDVRFAFLFGSFNEESCSPGCEEAPMPFHDIDVGVFLSGYDKKKSLNRALELSSELSSLVGVPVDIRVINFAPVTFLFHVVRGALLVDKDEDDRCAFMERVVRHYLDMKPLYHRAIKEAYG